MKEEKKLNIILGTHAHVPTGSSEEEFESAYKNIMRPFVSTLYKYSNVQAVLHYSGVLLYWVERTHPELFMLIEDMVSRKQIELLSGGFYEPVFPIIPQQDRIGQIELLTTYLRKHFGKRPVGSWLPYMAWEQNMAASLAASDISYTFLSKDQFKEAGLSGGDLYSPCITEDQGKSVYVFPVLIDVQKELETKSFSHVFLELKNSLGNKPENDNRIICVFPEKVSSSPEEAADTAWNRFFEEISLSENFIETILPSKILKNKKQFKKASFQNSSCLPEYSPRNFLIKNCDAAGIYSKMVFTNVLINQLKGDKHRKQNAREEFWKAQDSCLFTPGEGHYRNEYRKSAYSSLLRAEQLSREKGKFALSLIQYDFDFDGNMEYLFQDVKINIYIKLKGASVFELDYLPKEWNYMERYSSFADIILPYDTNVKNILDSYPANSRLCYNEQYEALAQDRKGKSCFKLHSIAANKQDSGQFNCIEINKCFLLKKDTLIVSYSIKNTNDEPINFCFVPEIYLSFAGEGDDCVRYYAIDKTEKEVPLDKYCENSCSLKILDVKNEVQIIFNSASVFSGSLMPVYENDCYQSTRILPFFPILLEAGRSWANEFSLKFSH